MDLTTRYMGLTLANPFVAAASPLSGSLDTIRQLEDNGAAAVVLFSLFEEQIAGRRRGPRRGSLRHRDRGGGMGLRLGPCIARSNRRSTWD
jgi:dihydroorotate dehydrogenase